MVIWLSKYDIKVLFQKFVRIYKGINQRKKITRIKNIFKPILYYVRTMCEQKHD